MQCEDIAYIESRWSFAGQARQLGRRDDGNVQDTCEHWLVLGMRCHLGSRGGTGEASKGCSQR